MRMARTSGRFFPRHIAMPFTIFTVVLGLVTAATAQNYVIRGNTPGVYTKGQRSGPSQSNDGDDCHGMAEPS